MTAQDTALRTGRSLILHGPLSDRVYLAKLAPEDASGMVEKIERLAAENGYGKIFAKVPRSLVGPFLDAGYVTEALVPGMFPHSTGMGAEDGHFVSRFPDPSRAKESNPGTALRALRLAGAKRHDTTPAAPPDDWTIERLSEADVDTMARIYDDTFSTYPFPINDPQYLLECMATHVFYYGVRVQGKLVALSGCETDLEYGLGEMTDFGSLPEARGNGAAFHLLDHMERDMATQGYRTAFTISRALSVPINVSFARRGYAYAGTLVANTNISGSLESMNVWFKTFNQ